MTAGRRHRMTRLSRLVDGMVAPSVRERGFVISRLVSNWRQIALQMKQPIIDRVNANFGYGAVADLVFVQTLAPRPAQPEPPQDDSTPSPAPLVESIWELDARLERINSPEIRAALRRLGRS